MNLRVRVIPNAKAFALAERDGMLVTRVPAPARDGKANRALGARNENGATEKNAKKQKNGKHMTPCRGSKAWSNAQD